VRTRANAWLEFHASMSMIAYGAFALACVAGLMYLLQERQLKRHQLHSVFQHLPPLHDLFVAITRLLWFGFLLYTAGLVSGFFTGQPLPVVKMVCAFAVWLFYGAILQGRYFFRLAPKQVAVLCVLAFSAAVGVLGGSHSRRNSRPPDVMNLFCVGISHHTANVETRERYARSRNIEAALREKGCAEALLLSTCNRVEVYGVAERFVESETVAAHLLPDSPAQTSDDAASFYRHEADECVQHLFRVACGLDSMVVGETEVLGQAKQAYATARDLGGAGPLLHRPFSTRVSGREAGADEYRHHARRGLRRLGGRWSSRARFLAN
jgi:hypothetical protein